MKINGQGEKLMNHYISPDCEDINEEEKERLRIFFLPHFYPKNKIYSHDHASTLNKDSASSYSLIPCRDKVHLKNI